MTSAPQEEEKTRPPVASADKTEKLPLGERVVALIDRVRKHPIGVVAVLIAAVLMWVTTLFGTFDLSGLTRVFAPVSTPTSLAFPPAKSGESLIIVADFEPRPKDAKLKDDPAQFIYEELRDQVRKDNMSIRVERLRQIVDDNTARPTGQVYSATMLVWGWFGNTTINPRIERFGFQTTYVSDQEDRRFSFANSERIEAILLRDLPSQAKYVIFFTLSLEQDERNDLATALRYADAALASVQSDADVNASDAYFHRGWIYQTRNNSNQAIADYNQAITLKPDFAHAFNNRGVAYTDKGETDRAIADYDQAITLKPDFAHAFNNRGVAYTDKGEYDRAITDFDQAINLKPDYAMAFSNRGVAYDDKGEHDRAITDFDQAINLKPDYAMAFNNRGVAYADKDEYDRAIADYDQAITLKPDYAVAFRNRGVAYRDKGELDHAIADFDQAITLKPDDAVAFRNRGVAYRDKGELDHAIADFDQAITLKPDDAVAFCNRGIAYYSKGEKEKAIADYDLAIKLKPDFAAAYWGRGLAYIGKADKAHALADLQKAIELTSDANERAQIKELIRQAQ